MILLLRLGAFAAFYALITAISFGYLGRLHPAFDAFSHLRMHLAALLLVLVPFLFWLRLRIAAGFAVVFCLTVMASTAWPDIAVSRADRKLDQPAYRLLQMNLRFDNSTPEAALSLIGEHRPDIITLVEVSDMWRKRLGLLEDAYPYRLICAQPSHIGGAAILSRRPLAKGYEPHCGDRGSFAQMRVDLGGFEIGIVALHMGWPWPFEQPWQLPRLMPLLENIGEDAIIAGDLNAVPWSNAASRVADAAGAQILRGIGPSWLDRRLPDSWRPLIGLPIDNLLLKGAVTAIDLRTLKNPGSDHLAVLLEFSLATREKATEMQVVGRQ